MNRTALIILGASIVAAFPCALWAAEADLCTGVVDPYNIVAEKGRFYASAGKDNELTATEFNETKITASSFRRSFDRWSEMLKFDKDGNKSLDWMEAGAYRYEMRKMMLASYDANRDGKLAGAERPTACKALASGRIRFAVKRPTHHPPPPKHHPDKDRKKSTHKPSSAKPTRPVKSDKHHDARKSQAAIAADKAAKLREIQKKRDEYQAKRDIAQFDKNKNGRLDANEINERNKHNADMKKRQSEGKKRHDDLMKKYDRDGDGKLDESEKKAVKEGFRQAALKRAADAREAARKKLEDVRARKEVQKFDKNKDGRLDPEESAALNEYRAKVKQRMDEYVRKYDTNGDGQVSPEEKKEYAQRLKEQKEEQRQDKDRDKPKLKSKKDPDKHKPPKSKKKHSKKDR